MGMQDENEDLDALLEQFALDDEAKSTVQVIEDCSPPSARVFASFTPNLLSVRSSRMAHESSLLCESVLCKANLAACDPTSG